jgi:site-specific DNA-methyltransferase (adenine-specific)
MGSGSTGVAALNEGFKFFGIEKEAEYIKIARHRLEYADSIKNESIA